MALFTTPILRALGIVERQNSPPSPVSSASTWQDPQAEVGDTLVDAFWAESSPALLNALPTWVWQLDGQLDDELFRAGLDKLSQHVGWRKIGARLERDSKDSKLRYRVPSSYSVDRPVAAINIANDFAHSRISDHPQLLAQFDLSPSGRSVQIASPIAQEYERFLRPQDATSPAYWINTGRPLLTFNIVHFQEATVLSMTIIHLIDGSGIGALMKALGAVLRGEEPEAFTGFDKDGLGAFVSEQVATKGEALIGLGDGWRRPEAVQAAAMKLWSAWEAYWFPKRLMKHVYIHADEFKCLKSKVLADLKTGERVSENDILAAWILKAFSPAYTSRFDGPFLFSTVIDLRTCLLSVFPPATAFIHNAVTVAQFPPIEPAYITSQSLSKVALWHRRHLLAATTDDSIASLLIAARQGFLSPASQLRLPIPYINGLLLLLPRFLRFGLEPVRAPNRRTMSNCTKTGWADFDLGGAARGEVKSLKVVNTSMLRPVEDFRAGSAVPLKDEKGGYLLMLFAREKAWKEIENTIVRGIQ